MVVAALRSTSMQRDAPVHNMCLCDGHAVELAGLNARCPSHGVFDVVPVPSIGGRIGRIRATVAAWDLIASNEYRFAVWAAGKWVVGAADGEAQVHIYQAEVDGFATRRRGEGEGAIEGVQGHTFGYARRPVEGWCIPWCIRWSIARCVDRSKGIDDHVSFGRIVGGAVCDIAIRRRCARVVGYRRIGARGQQETEEKEAVAAHTNACGGVRKSSGEVVADARRTLQFGG